MNASEPKPEKEILESLADATKVFIVGCTGCPVGCDVGGEPWVAATKVTLENAGKTVSGSALVEMLCNKALVGVKLGRYSVAILASDAILVGSCGVGVQAVSRWLIPPTTSLWLRSAGVHRVSWSKYNQQTGV